MLTLKSLIAIYDLIHDIVIFQPLMIESICQSNLDLFMFVAKSYGLSIHKACLHILGTRIFHVIILYSYGFLMVWSLLGNYCLLVDVSTVYIMDL